MLKRATSPAVLETLCPIPVWLDPQQPDLGLHCVVGPEGQGIPREAVPWANTSHLGREPSTGVQTLGSRNACTGAMGCGCAGREQTLIPCPAKIHISVLSCQLSSPLKFRSSRQITRVIFLLFFLSPSLAGMVQRQLKHITDVQGGSSPGSALPRAPPQHCFPGDTGDGQRHQE